ncbi:hypothetical protein Tco_1235922 [Tanacetum coccineum]
MRGKNNNKRRCINLTKHEFNPREGGDEGKIAQIFNGRLWTDSASSERVFQNRRNTSINSKASLEGLRRHAPVIIVRTENGTEFKNQVLKVYNRRTKKIIETMNVTFDELLAMAFEQTSSKPGLQSMTSGQISSGLDLTYAPSTITTQQPSGRELDLLF